MIYSAGRSPVVSIISLNGQTGFGATRCFAQAGGMPELREQNQLDPDPYSSD